MCNYIITDLATRKDIKYLIDKKKISLYISKGNTLYNGDVPYHLKQQCFYIVSLYCSYASTALRNEDVLRVDIFT